MLNHSSEAAAALQDSAELGQCTARVPALGVLARCSEPATVRERVSCDRGHEHVAISCAAHRFTERVSIGCLPCLQMFGDDRPLRLLEVLP